MLINTKVLGRLFVAGATFLTPADNFSSWAGEQKTSASEDASSPDYLKGKSEDEIDALVKKAIEDPDSDFTYKLFSNPKLYLKSEYVEFVTDEKYCNGRTARTVASLPRFPISAKHMKFVEDHPDAELAQIISDNLNCKSNIGKVTVVTDASFRKKVLDSDLPVLVDFWAPWCPICIRNIDPIMKEIAEKYSGKLIVLKLNIDENPREKGLYGISSVPVLTLIKGKGEKGIKYKVESDICQRVQSYTLDSISSVIDEHLKD